MVLYWVDIIWNLVSSPITVVHFLLTNVLEINGTLSFKLEKFNYVVHITYHLMQMTISCVHNILVNINSAHSWNFQYYIVE